MSTATLPLPAALSKPVVRAGRFDSIDILRGLVMIIMALDHSRGYLTHLRFEPETLSLTYPALFFTRWITHFCAPLFFFLAGTGAYFYGSRHTPMQLRRFLWTRGLWLILLEFTVIGTGWTFQIFGFFGVIWALGACMIMLAALSRLPLKWLATLSLTVIATHNLLDGIRPEQFGRYAWMWTILHVRGGAVLPFGIFKFVLFPLVPWFAVMGAGYAFGALYQCEPERRRKLILRLGLGLTLGFVLLRVTNLYGNPPESLGAVSQGEWHVQPTVAKTVILFLDVEKYPPSLQFLLMTLGPSLLLLAWLEKKLAQGSTWALAAPVLVFGRVPLFFYVIHIYVIHIMAILVAVAFRQPVNWLFHGAFFAGTPNGYGHNLPFIYLIWITAIFILYFPCRWWAGLKRRRKDWWLSYL
jgi:uncharacterized membrane protein